LFNYRTFSRFIQEVISYIYVKDQAVSLDIFPQPFIFSHGTIIIKLLSSKTGSPILRTISLTVQET